MRTLALIGLGLIAFAGSATAQNARFSVRPTVGAFVGTGDQRDLVKDAVAVGGQASYQITPAFAVVGNFAWSPTELRTAPVIGDDKLDIFQYDIGAELGLDRPLGSSWTIRPSVGLGAGARTYNQRDVAEDASTDFAGYGSLAVELNSNSNRFGLRLEGRDYVTAFDGLSGELDSEARNDLTFLAGLNVRF